MGSFAHIMTFRSYDVLQLSRIVSRIILYLTGIVSNMHSSWDWNIIFWVMNDKLWSKLIMWYTQCFIQIGQRPINRDFNQSIVICNVTFEIPFEHLMQFTMDLLCEWLLRLYWWIIQFWLTKRLDIPILLKFKYDIYNLHSTFWAELVMVFCTLLWTLDTLHSRDNQLRIESVFQDKKFPNV